MRGSLLRHAEKRILFLVRAMTAFYLSIGSFATASLVSLFGGVFVAAHQELMQQLTLVTSLCAFVVGVTGLTYGSALLVLETRSATRSLKEETQFMLNRHTGK